MPFVLARPTCVLFLSYHVSLLNFGESLVYFLLLFRVSLILYNARHLAQHLLIFFVFFSSTCSTSQLQMGMTHAVFWYNNILTT